MVFRSRAKVKVYQISDKIDHQKLRYGASGGVYMLIHANLTDLPFPLMFTQVIASFPNFRPQNTCTGLAFRPKSRGHTYLGDSNLGTPPYWSYALPNFSIWSCWVNKMRTLIWKSTHWFGFLARHRTHLNPETHYRFYCTWFGTLMEMDPAFRMQSRWRVSSSHFTLVEEDLVPVLESA